jgi:hypothetical protein
MMRHALLICMLVLLFVNGNAKSAPATVQIELPKAAHFLSPTGDDIVLGPGAFDVEAADDGLRLTPKIGKPDDARIVKAHSIAHPELLKIPQPLVESIGKDRLRVALLLTDGTGLEAVASLSAISQRDLGARGTAFGTSALAGNLTGTDNTALGYFSLFTNSSGNGNTAVGSNVLYHLTKGMGNTGLGVEALNSQYEGNMNTAIGMQTLRATTNGVQNTAVGAWALRANSTGHNNTAIGIGALRADLGGNYNTAIGHGAGAVLTNGTNNLYVSNWGISTESNTIRIGTINGNTPIGAAPVHTRTFLAGIKGVPVSGDQVLVTADGQLGVKVSSLRYKEDIQDMGEGSRGLYKLRPVTFRYKHNILPENSSREYGLIAEEVAVVYPDLVGRDREGQILTVQYHEMVPLLLNEVQEQHRLNQLRSRQIEIQERRIEELESRLAKLEIK